MISDELFRLAAVCARRPLTLRGLTAAMGPREHAVLTMFLGVCFLHPVPMPGISTVLGAIIAIAGARIALGLGPWIPRRWEDHPLPAAAIGKALEKAGKLARRLEPRRAEPAAWMERKAVRVLIGACVALCGFLIILPFPPPTNFPPAIALVLVSAATITRRPVLLAVALAAVAANVVLFAALTAGAGAAALKLLR